MNVRRTSIASLVAAAVVAGIGSGAVFAGGEPLWLTALHARSEALNVKYGLGEHARSASSAQPDWLRALAVRSEALNRKYELGEYATP